MGRPKGKSRSFTKSYIHCVGCAAGWWHGATGHPLNLSPKLSSLGGSLTKDSSLVSKEIGCLRAWTRQLFNQAKRTGYWNHTWQPSPVTIKRSQNIEPSPWREYCWGFEDVSDRARLFKIMVIKATNKVGSYKLLKGWYIQLEKMPWRNFTRYIFQDLRDVKWPRKGNSGHTWVLLYLTGRNGNYLEGSSINPKCNKR